MNTKNSLYEHNSKVPRFRGILYDTSQWMNFKIWTTFWVHSYRVAASRTYCDLANKKYYPYVTISPISSIFPSSIDFSEVIPQFYASFTHLWNGARCVGFLNGQRHNVWRACHLDARSIPPTQYHIYVYSLTWTFALCKCDALRSVGSAEPGMTNNSFRHFELYSQSQPAQTITRTHSIHKCLSMRNVIWREQQMPTRQSVAAPPYLSTRRAANTSAIQI